MNEQGNGRAASGNGSDRNGKGRSKPRHGHLDYDVPIPRPTSAFTVSGESGPATIVRQDGGTIIKQTGSYF